MLLQAQKRAITICSLLSFAMICLPATGFAQKSEKEIEDLKTVESAVEKRVQRSTDNNFISFSLENDSFGGGTDQYYTSGGRITYFNVDTPVPQILRELAELIPTFDLNDTTGTYYTLGQNIYTPQDITIEGPQPNDRPYAGFLYGAVGLTSITDNHMDEVELTLGVVGPAALGEEIQSFVHENITSSPEPQGWDEQLKNEPAAIISFRRRWPTWFRQNIGPLRFRIEPDVNVSLGNVYTYAGTGATATIGPYSDRLQDTPPRVRPSIAGTGYFDSKDFSWYLFAGIEGRAVGRNIFLDGNTFTDSPSVDKKHFVGDANVGFAVALDDVRFAYTLNYRPKEFDQQEDESVFGSVTLSTRF